MIQAPWLLEHRIRSPRSWKGAAQVVVAGDGERFGSRQEISRLVDPEQFYVRSAGGCDAAGCSGSLLPLSQAIGGEGIPPVERARLVWAGSGAVGVTDDP